MFIYNKISPTKICHYNTFLHALTLLPDGEHYCGHNKGYIKITTENSKRDIMWTSDRKTHNSAFSGYPCRVASFNPESITHIYQSAVTMWPVEKEDKKIIAVNFLVGATIEAAKYRGTKTRQALAKQKKKEKFKTTFVGKLIDKLFN